ncbi:MAG TPA: trehalose-phosphatase [Caulobacteraceae bacterium]|nr:trehalose-phosphatase [Caulobacteraceae bacterium]
MIQTQPADCPLSLPLARAALFLDLDGTLAPIAATPCSVEPEPRRLSVLSRAQTALDGRVAIVSGREIDDVDRICGGRIDCVAGVHGLEWRGQDRVRRSGEPHPMLERAVRDLAAMAAGDRRLLLERKHASAALHYRAAPEAAARIEGAASRIAWSSGLVLQRGKMVVELRTPGPDKGDALRSFMIHEPFLGATPIYVGDDLTDEPAFVAAQRMGGLGVCIAPLGTTAARYRLAGQEVVLDWIERGLDTGEFTLEACS